MSNAIDSAAYSAQFPDHGNSAADHDKNLGTAFVVSAYYRVHPEDRQAFIDAVIPEMTAARKMPGCVYYAFAQDLTDANLFHLVEGWADEASYEGHEAAETFLAALSTVVKHVRILDRQGVRYEVARQIIDDPRDKVA
ncbi:antibiotic biosynthesis monooxygenase [Herbaspirillum sp. LeCh32-8]|uniref:putative quinol monooxygenase n=1 Tax=Herbaspirillum sp. LeCh32-8 TaxID=2821356 RepID=UPI001AE282C5|nr:antibiotic biosynthesis monooxygenase family protein [Herbaspirillum sp. LeCh32-8]MBP0597986.1 antibiotic biosynthesis monooxygenase [Herbaspirillum sp. LeCh32-8]